MKKDKVHLDELSMKRGKNLINETRKSVDEKPNEMPQGIYTEEDFVSDLSLIDTMIHKTVERLVYVDGLKANDKFYISGMVMGMKNQLLTINETFVELCNKNAEEQSEVGGQ